MSIPKSASTPLVKLNLGLSDANAPDPTKLVRKAQYRAMLNGGYIARFELFDPNSAMLNAMIDAGYFEQARDHPIEVTYQFKWHDDGQYPEQATKEEKGYMASIKAWGKAPNANYLEFIAIDPPSWWLNIGDAAGSAWKGNISSVIQQVVGKYAPGIGVTVSETQDNNQNYWWMMRQDPKTFLNSLIDYSSSFTKSKTSWIVVPDNDVQITFAEQASITSNARGYYTHNISGVEIDTLQDWSFLADNALSLSNTKIVTHGLSAISGQYFDRKTDQGETEVFAKDSTTSAKYIADVDQQQSYNKPPDDWTSTSGYTSVGSIPEIYSAGDSGLNYKDYIDGKARGLYLNMVNMLFRAKFSVIGHGEWIGCDGLGTDTIYVRWDQADGSYTPYFLNGNWLVYGYEHRLDVKSWWTDIYCARFDYDADATKVGGGGS